MSAVGFTGTQHGLTTDQRETLEHVLFRCRSDELHHGDCVGADAEAHAVASFWGMRIVVHPGPQRDKRAFCENLRPDLWDDLEVREPMDELKRDRVIVVETVELVACPRQLKEVLRSGTWATVRYARKAGKPVTIIWPDGQVGR